MPCTPGSVRLSSDELTICATGVRVHGKPITPSPTVLVSTDVEVPGWPATRRLGLPVVSEKWARNPGLGRRKSSAVSDLECSEARAGRRRYCLDAGATLGLLPGCGLLRVHRRPIKPPRLRGRSFSRR